MGKLNTKGIAVIAALIGIIVRQLDVLFETGCFVYHFERVADGICQIAIIVPSLIKELHTNWQAVNRQHCACCNHKNVILNEKSNLGAVTRALTHKRRL